MRVPERLEPLLDFGVIEEVLRPLMSGKEAEVYLVRSEGEERVAKVYKNAQFRSFQHRVEYTEGRRVRSSREQRAMNKQSKHGRAKTEEAWQSAESDAIQMLKAAGVRVPTPYVFSEGVLVMELVKGADGQPAPRLVDTHFSPEEATEVFHILLREVVKMLCAGIIHADLSDFNVLLGADGPVIIDFPQAVDPSRNQSARQLLLRDVRNLTSFLGRFAPALRRTQYGPEMWDLYERSELRPDTELTGKYQSKKKTADVSSLLAEIMEVEAEARERREALGLPPPRPARKPVVFVDEPEPEPAKPSRRRRGGKGGARSSDRGPERGSERGPERGSERPGKRAAPVGQAATSDAPKKRRRRRRRRSGGSAEAGPANSGRPANAHAGPSKGARPAPAPGGDPKPGSRPPAKASAPPAAVGEGSAPPRRRRRRRRRRGGGGGGDGPSSDG